MIEGAGIISRRHTRIFDMWDSIPVQEARQAAERSQGVRAEYSYLVALSLESSYFVLVGF